MGGPGSGASGRLGQVDAGSAQRFAGLVGDTVAVGTFDVATGDDPFADVGIPSEDVDTWRAGIDVEEPCEVGHHQSGSP